MCSFRSRQYPSACTYTTALSQSARHLTDSLQRKDFFQVMGCVSKINGDARRNNLPAPERVVCTRTVVEYPPSFLDYGNSDTIQNTYSGETSSNAHSTVGDTRKGYTIKVNPCWRKKQRSLVRETPDTKLRYGEYRRRHAPRAPTSSQVAYKMILHDHSERGLTVGATSGRVSVFDTSESCN